MSSWFVLYIPYSPYRDPVLSAGYIKRFFLTITQYIAGGKGEGRRKKRRNTEQNPSCLGLIWMNC